MQRTNQRDDREGTTPRETQANSKTPAPQPQSPNFSRVVTPEHEKGAVKVPQDQQGNFIPLTFPSDYRPQHCQPTPSVKLSSWSFTQSKRHYMKPHPLKSLSKQPSDSSDKPTLALVKFQAPPRPQAVSAVKERPLSPPALQNLPKTAPPVLAEWSPIALQEPPQDFLDDWPLFSDDVLDFLCHPMSG